MFRRPLFCTEAGRLSCSAPVLLRRNARFTPERSSSASSRPFFPSRQHRRAHRRNGFDLTLSFESPRHTLFCLSPKAVPLKQSDRTGRRSSRMPEAQKKGRFPDPLFSPCLQEELSSPADRPFLRSLCPKPRYGRGVSSGVTRKS